MEEAHFRRHGPWGDRHPGLGLAQEHPEDDSIWDHPKLPPGPLCGRRQFGGSPLKVTLP